MSYQQNRGHDRGPPSNRQDYNNRGYGRGGGERPYDGGNRAYTPRNHDDSRPYTPRSNDGSDRGGFRGGRGRGRGGGNFLPKYSGEARPHCLTGEGAIFPIEVKPDAVVYRYEVRMIYKSKKFSGDPIEHDMTTEKRDSRARQFCYHVMSHLMDMTHNFGNSKIQVAYDNQNTLLSNFPFKRVIEEMVKDDLPEEASVCLAGNGQVYVEITENEKMPTIDLNDLAQYEARELLLNEDQTVRQMLEIILSQGAINSGEYDVIGNGELFRKTEDKLERGFCTRIGSSKGIRMIDMEAKDAKGATIKRIKPAMVIDFKKSPFYCSGMFINLVLDFLNGSRGSKEEAFREAEAAFRNIKLSPIYQPNRVLRFTKFTSKRFSELTLEDDNTGEVMGLVEFFLKKKHLRLERADLPGATCQRDGDFPLELLRVLPNQRVDMQFIPSYIRDNVHRQNAVDPQVRYNNIMDEVHHLNFNNEVTKAFGISLNLEPVEKATVLQFDRPDKPKILLGGGKIINPQDDGRFNIGFGRYYRPATIEKWAVLFPSNAPGEEIKAFVDKFTKAAEDRGIQFKSQAKPTQFRGTRFADLRHIFEGFQKEKIHYVLMVDRKSNVASHGILKLVESLYKIVTQQVTLEILQKILHQNQNLTLANILHKFNVKNGGTNYVPQFTEAAKRLDINTGNVLVIGYDVSHPTGCNPEERTERIKKGFESETRDPSIVGISANYTAEPSVFAGDFFFQPTRQEKVDSEELKIRTQRILETIKRNRGQMKGFKMPEVIVILRDGVSEGQFRMACEDELPSLRAGCFLFDPKYKPKFVFIVATKRHHKRFFEGKDGRFVNPAAGSFVDENIVRPDCVEFFMACHKAIKGTAKFVQVCVIQDDLNVTRDELKHFLHSLCYGHQVVTSPTSLPTPIYIADELATRGSEIFKTLKDEAPMHIPWKNEEIDYLALTKMLGYLGTDLGNVRFNA